MNVLVIGDLHTPFTLEDYLDHCKSTRDKFQCDQVVFIGDQIDNHYPSFHESDPDGWGGKDELELSISKLEPWHKEFPKAYVTQGNHDLIVMRKVFSGGIPKQWLRDYNDVLGTHGWDWQDQVEIDGVLYCHGTGGQAKTKAKGNMQSTVCGHYHTHMYVEWMVGTKFRIFAMQVGCGINHKTYAMAYGKWFKKPAIACGVVLGGEVAINIPMNL